MVTRRSTIVLFMLLSLCMIVSTTTFGWQYVDSIGSTSFGGSARGAALSADGAYLYIAGVQDRAIWKYDVSTGAQVAYVHLGSINAAAWGKAVYVASDGTVWAPATEPEIYQFDADLNLLAKYDLRPFGIQNPEGIAVGADEAVYVTDRKGTVGVYKLYVQDGRIQLATEFGKDGHVAVGADLRQPAIAQDGSVLVGDFASASGAVYKVDPHTGDVSPFATGVIGGYHMDVDAAGNAYIVQYGNPVAVTVLDRDGNVMSTKTPEELGLATEASGIAVSADGERVYVLDQRPSYGGGARVFRTTE